MKSFGGTKGGRKETIDHKAKGEAEEGGRRKKE